MSFFILSNHLVRSRQHVRRNREADLFSGFKINHKLKLHRLLYREVSRFGTFQNFVYVDGSAAPLVGKVGRVGHQSPSINNLRATVYRWQSVLSCELHDTLQLVIDEGFGRNNESLGMLSQRCFKRTVKIVGTSHFKGLDLEA